MPQPQDAEGVIAKFRELQERVKPLLEAAKGKRFKLSRKKGQRITIPASTEPTEILVTHGKAHLSFRAGLAVEWEGKKQSGG